MNVAFRQGKIFKKFKESKKFAEMVKELGFNQSTIYFEINLLTMLVKYPKLKKSRLSLNLFNTNLKPIKVVCKESGNECK